jgi:tRNA nucleotidyltransferase (CCA-adding enzyme)
MNGVDIKQAFQAQSQSLVEAVLLLANEVAKQPITSVPPRVLLAGGVVRNLILGKAVTDADVEVYGVPATNLRALTEKLFPGRVHDVGSAFSVLKVSLRDGLFLDIALPRRESKTGKGHKGFEVTGDPSMNVTEAARRRDFTINTMLADVITGEVLDPFRGMQDIHQRILRIVDPHTFTDDPLRVYRALQFAARFELTTEPRTRELLVQMVEQGVLNELPKERVTEEVRKWLLGATRPSIGFNLAWDIGVIERNYPELYALKATPQEPTWHPEGDVWIHTLMVVDEAARIIRRTENIMPSHDHMTVMLGALCHDLGKPAVTETIDGRIRSHEHEAGGEAPTRALLARWTFGVRVEEAAISIVKNHLKPGMLLRELEKGTMTQAQYVNAVRRLLKKIHPLSWQTFLAACEADWRGRDLASVRGPYAAGERFAEVVRREQLHKHPVQTLLRGEDLLALGIESGKRIGEIIQVIEDARDAGEISTKDEALRLAKTLV